VHRKIFICLLRHYYHMLKHFRTLGSICKPRSANTANSMNRRCRSMKNASSKRLCRYCIEGWHDVDFQCHFPAFHTPRGARVPPFLPFSSLVHLLPYLLLRLLYPFSFSGMLYPFSSFVHPFPFYQNSHYTVFRLKIVRSNLGLVCFVNFVLSVVLWNGNRFTGNHFKNR